MGEVPSGAESLERPRFGLVPRVVVGLGISAIFLSGCQLPDSQPAPAVVGVFKPVDCSKTDVGNLAYENMLPLQVLQLYSIAEQTQEAICNTANTVGANIVEMYRHHSDWVTFKNSPSTDQYAFEMKNSKNGAYGEVFFSSNPKSGPNLSMLQSAMIGVEATVKGKKVDGDVSEDNLGTAARPDWSMEVGGDIGLNVQDIQTFQTGYYATAGFLTYIQKQQVIPAGLFAINYSHEHLKKKRI